MRLIYAVSLLLVACSFTDSPQPLSTGGEQATRSRPNILLIVADDLGYSELGSYGSEISTPAIDSLAATGVRYTSFYAHSNCSPTRAMLFSGMDSHLAGLGAMLLALGPNQVGEPGYEGHLNDRTVSVAKLLRDSGYKTFMAGKWHLGESPDTLPAARGFDRYFAQTKGSPPGGHFNLDGAHPDARGIYFEDGTDRTGTPVGSDFYSSNFFTDKLIEYLSTSTGSDSPFFAYLAFSAPHIPVQAPESHIDSYQGRYDEGYDVTRERRLNQMRKLGLVRDNVTPGHRAPTVTPWSALDQQERRVQARRMEVYAGAVDNMDDNVGRLLEFLRNSDQFDNTLILFMSDNGAAGFYGWQSEALIQRYEKADNSLENLGRDGSMMFYGPGWASAGSAPFYLFKRHMSEGGIRVPLIISGPGVERPGSINHQVLTVRDIAPTLLDIAGTQYPKKTYEGRKILPQSGISFANLLRGDNSAVHKETEVLGWELFKRRSVRKGNWKALWLEPPFGVDGWQLYDLSSDPGETRDLAGEAPEKLAEMIAAWDQYAKDSNVIISDGPLILP